MKFSLQPLGDFFTFQKGLGYLGKYLEPSKVALVGLNSFEGGGGYKFGGEKEYSGPFKVEHTATPGDLFISTTDITQDGRVLASPFIMPNLTDRYEAVIFSGDIVKATPIADGLLPEFVYNVLRVKAFRQKAAYASSGSTVRRIPIEVLERLEVPVPPKEIQARIARQIALFDKKIETNSGISLRLEQIAQTIFKSWFVDFDPVHAKIRGEQPEGMDSATAALFPDSFEDSDMGPIPAGWSVKPLTEISEFLNGLALQKYPAVDDEENLPVIKIPQLKSGVAKGSGEASSAIPPKYVVEDGDILFSWSGALEVVLWAGGKGALNQHLFKVIPKGFPTWFSLHTTLVHLPEFREIAASKATTMGHIQRGHLSDALSVIPSETLLERASALIAPLLDASVAHRIENRTLLALRESLLQRLISGELSIPDELLGE